MSTARLIVLGIACAAVVFFVGAYANMQRSGAGRGEVSVILQGVFMVAALGLAAFFGVVAVMVAQWHRRRLRIGLLVVVCGSIGAAGLWVGYGVVSLHLYARAFQRQQVEREVTQAAREAALSPIALRYYDRLVAQGLTADAAVALGPAFEQEIDATGLEHVYKADAVGYFRSAHALYLRLFLNSDGTMEEFYGLINASACVHFQADLGDGFDAGQKIIFAKLCPDWLMDYVRD